MSIRGLKRKKQQGSTKKVSAQPLSGHPASALVDSALTFWRMGMVNRAEHLLADCLKHHPHHDPAWHLLGLIHRQQGQALTARKYLGEAIRINPKNPKYFIDLANIQYAAHDYQQTIINLQKAIDLGVKSKDIYFDLGNCYKAAEDYANALQAYQHSISLDPTNHFVFLQLGHIFRESGEVSKAVAAYEKVIELAPDCAESYYYLAITRKHNSLPREEGAMKNFLAQPQLPDQQKFFPAFGLGKIYEDLQDYDTSFHYYKLGNELLRKHAPFDMAETDRYLDYIINAFTLEEIEKHRVWGCKDPTPIFVVGMPRSGTSLVEQILASHPLVYGAGELDYLLKVLFTPDPALQFHKYPEDLLHLPPASYQLLGEKYIAQLRAVKGSPRHIVDKLPGNFLYLGAIRMILARAKVIHCCRDPLDTCFSCYKNAFGFDRHTYSTDLSDLGGYYLRYRKLMRHWHEVLPGFIYDVEYEKMVSDQEEEARKLLDFCELPWDDRCREFHRTQRVVSTSSDVQVRQPLYATSIQLWRKYEKHLAPLISILSGQDRV